MVHRAKFTAHLLPVIFTAALLLSSCALTDDNPQSGDHSDLKGSVLGIYLADTDELVLSDKHIKSYHRDTVIYEGGDFEHSIKLNAAGIVRWNSFLTYEGVPKLNDTLYKKDFIIKINNEEMYRGKFYSMVSSSSYKGVVILDALVKLDENNNRLLILSGYGGINDHPAKDARNNPAIMDFLKKQGLLK
ncbi:hypothetical protein ACFLUG_02265 [Chloroflexota bacterium]